MTGGVSVLVPFRPDGGPRDAVWVWCLAQWRTRHPSWPVYVADCGDGPWVKADAVAEAASNVRGGIVVVADADVWCERVTAAVQKVREGVPWARPHRHVLRLTQRATDGVLAGRPLVDDTERPAYHGHDGGGIVVLPLETLLEVPLPRLAGWGEDDSWALRLRTIKGPCWEGTAPLWHLWHPSQPRHEEWPKARQERHGTPAAKNLLDRHIRAAQSGPEAMRDLIAAEAAAVRAAPG